MVDLSRLNQYAISPHMDVLRKEGRLFYVPVGRDDLGAPFAKGRRLGGRAAGVVGPYITEKGPSLDGPLKTRESTGVRRRPGGFRPSFRCSAARTACCQRTA